MDQIVRRQLIPVLLTVKLQKTLIKSPRPNQLLFYDSPGRIEAKFLFNLNVPFLKASRPSPPSIIATPDIRSEY